MTTNSAAIRAGLTEFTEIFYYDYRKRKNPRQLKDDSFAGFNERYIIFQDVSSDQYPGEEIGPVIVDVMFQVVTINERKMIGITIDLVKSLSYSEYDIPCHTVQLVKILLLFKSILLANTWTLSLL